jgi:TonB family protein
MDAARPRLRIVVDASSPAQTALSVVLGAGFTLALFMGMAHFSIIRQVAPQAAIEDLRSVALPFEPPPPLPASPAEQEPVPEMAVTGFDFSPSDSPVKIAVSPPSFNDLVTSNEVAPPANIRIGQLNGEFKPRIGLAVSPQHVYQRTEVDNPPVVLFRAVPPISQRLFGDSAELRITLLFVVEPDGAITNVRVAKSSGIPDVDTIVTENVQHEWGFAPATKKGRKVRCLLEQLFRIQLPRASHFQA